VLRLLASCSRDSLLFGFVFLSGDLGLQPSFPVLITAAVFQEGRSFFFLGGARQRWFLLTYAGVFVFKVALLYEAGLRQVYLESWQASPPVRMDSPFSLRTILPS